MTLADLLFIGFGITLLLWLALSLWTIANRLVYDRRRRALMRLAEVLSEAASSHEPKRASQSALSQLAAHLSRRGVYRLVADIRLPPWVSRVYAAYALDRWGLDRIIRDASVLRGRRHKWRRISALSALGQLRVEAAHDLLALAIADPDCDVAAAAVVILHRLGDERAATILVRALREELYAPSRIATQLDQFTVPIDDLLVPMLADARPHARFWAVSLLGRYPHAPRLAEQIVPLARDVAAPVRKAVLETLGELDATAAESIALTLLRDPVPFVRAQAVRTIAKRASAGSDSDARRDVAHHISPLLGDADWYVRLAAKDSLVALGPTVWREVAVGLDSPDRFARGTSAEVLQDIGLLDHVIEDVGHGVAPSDELAGVLRRAFDVGGRGMIDAAAARSDPELFPSVEQFLASLRFAGVRLS